MPEQRIVLVPGGWYVAAARTGKEIDTPIVSHLRDRGGVVHVARLDPPSPVVANCGKPLDAETSLIVDAPVTCRAGCG